MSDGIFTLNCFVLGDQYSQVFQVEIPNTKTVSSLKKEIKNEKNITFQTVDADAIQPYQVSISEADYETKLEPFLDPAGVPDANILSRPLAKLRDLFPSPAEEHIHVIMARPSACECERSLDDFDPCYSNRPCPRQRNDQVLPVWIRVRERSVELRHTPKALLQIQPLQSLKICLKVSVHSV